MTPSNISIILGLLILLGTAPAAVAADELATPNELATPDQLATLASKERQLRAESDERLAKWVAAATEDEGELLAARTMALLRHPDRRVARRDVAAPVAKQARAAGPSVTRVQGEGNTTCTSVGDTLACVARDLAAR